jgi:hypothetical protein
MTSNADAWIGIRTTPHLRNSLLGKVRTRGITMQGFLVEVLELLDTDEGFLTTVFAMVEAKRAGVKSDG